MYTTMLEPTTITSKKKLHLARRTMPGLMEDMGYVGLSSALSLHDSPLTMTAIDSVHADEVDAIGHWEGNTRRETYAAKIPKSVSLPLLSHLHLGQV